MPNSLKTIERLVHEHYESLYRYAYRLSGSAVEAEDLTQETFVKAQSHLHQLREEDRARSWLFSILRNAFLHRARDNKAPTIRLDAVPEIAETDEDPFPEIDQERLQEALMELPEAFRAPLLLYYFDSFSYRDIAEQMDLPIGTVMSRLSRAKAVLRAKLLPVGSSVLESSDRARRSDGL